MSVWDHLTSSLGRRGTIIDPSISGNPEKPNVRFSTELKGHAARIEKIGFNPARDAELCSVSADGVVKFWDVRTKACIFETRSLGEALSLAWHPLGECVVVGTRDDILHVIRPRASGSASSNGNGNSGTAGGTTTGTTAGGTTIIAPESSRQMNVHTNSLAFAWDGTRVFATTGDGAVRILAFPSFEPTLWYNSSSLPEGRREFTMNGHTSSCTAVELDPAGKYLATGGTDSRVVLWDTKQWLSQRTISSLQGPIRTISFTFDGAYVIGGSEDGESQPLANQSSGAGSWEMSM